MEIGSFIRAYQNRVREFSNYSQRFLKTAYVRLRNGSEIRYTQIKKVAEDHRLYEILTAIPQFETIQSRVVQAVEDVELTQVPDFLFIYGDYGHGKSQLSNLLLEYIIKENKANNFIYLNLITTYRAFAVDFAVSLAAYLQESHPAVLGEVQQYLNRLSIAQSHDEIGSNEIALNVIKALEACSNHNITTIIIHDEVDKILHDDLEKTIWVDYIAQVRDSDNIALLSILFVPQQSGDQLFATERRLERLKHASTVNAVRLNGRYGNKLEDAYINILALHTKYTDEEFSNQALQFFHLLFEIRQSKLQLLNLRETNLWVIGVCELLRYFEDFNIWDELHRFTSFDTIQQSILLEEKLRLFIQEDSLPQYSCQTLDDEQEEAFYRVEYLNNLLNKVKGYYALYKISGLSEQEAAKVAIHIYYSISNPPHSQIAAVVELARQNPVIAFFLGPTKQQMQAFEKILKLTLAKNIENYPVHIIVIPKLLLSPLLTLPSTINSDSFEVVKQHLINWAILLAEYREGLTQFLKDLPNQLDRRALFLYQFKVAGVHANNESASVDPQPESTSFANKEVPREYRIFAAGVATEIDRSSRFKSEAVILRDQQDILWNFDEGFANRVPELLQHAYEKLEYYQFISRKMHKRGPVVSKDIHWNRDKAIEVIITMLGELQI